MNENKSDNEMRACIRIVASTMNEVEKKVFGMYQNTINDEHCRRCLKKDEEIRSHLGKRERCGPISYWKLGKNVADGNPVRLAFVGKTTWMEPSDLRILQKIGPIWDGTPEFEEFWNEYPKWSRFWKSLRTITEGLKLTPDDIFVTNLIKCNIYDKAFNQFGNITGWKYFDSCIDIFEKEMEIVKPSHIVFFTNDYYDSLINRLRFGYISSNCECKDLSSRHLRRQISQRAIRYRDVSWWHRVFLREGTQQMHFLRTRHPQGAPREFEEEIVHWVKKQRFPS